MKKTQQPAQPAGTRPRWPRVREARIAFAAEVRKAAWVVAAVFATFSLWKGSLVGYVVAMVIWSIIQMCAFLVLAATKPDQSNLS